MLRMFAATSAAVLALTANNVLANAQEHAGHHTGSAHPQGHAPLGVMGDHGHDAGEWMTSYRYSTMRMKGNRDGNDSVSTSEVLADFMVAPTEMTMEMHMFGVMYGVSDELTVMAMLPYVRKSMDHINRMGVTFETESKGLGDAKISGLYTFHKDETHTWHLNAGLSLPTGSIDEKDTTPMGYVRLPYAMQLGSGTFDLLPGVTYNGHNADWSWGGQLNAVIRIGENDNDYRLGNEYAATVWGARRINEYVSLSARLDGKAWGDVSGADPQLNPMMVPTARTDLRGGRRIDALAGINVELPQWHGNRFAVEFGAPVYQHLDGPQMETDYRLIAGWQFAF